MWINQFGLKAPVSSDYLKLISFHFLMPGLLVLALVFCLDDKLTANKKILVKQITPCLYNGMWCKSINQQQIAILFPKQITYLTPFPIQVRSQNKGRIQQMQLQFSMRGMQMATNRFTLNQRKDNKHGKDTFWQTEVVLSRCISDRKDWLVELVVKTKNKVETSNFMITVW